MVRTWRTRSFGLFAACAAIAAAATVGTACGEKYGEDESPGTDGADTSNETSTDGSLPVADAATTDVIADAVADADAKALPPSAVGVLDESFAMAGTTPAINGRPGAIAIQADGKIVVTGYDATNALTVWRFLANGAPDASFATTGVYRLGIGNNSYAKGLAIDGSGRIVVGGYIDYVGDGNSKVSLVMRLLPGGTIDPAFGADGGRFEDDIKVGVDDYVNAITILADGRIIAAGGAVEPSPTFVGSTFLGLSSTGSLDPAFGSGGVLMTTTILGTHGMVLEGDKVYGTGGPNGAIGFSILRLTTAGAVDSTFGSGGRVVTPIGTFGISRVMARAAGDPMIVVGGAVYVGAGQPQDSRFGVVRYKLDGTTDPTFGSSGGSVLALASGSYEAVLGLALQADGRIIAAGASDTARVIARFTTSGAADPSFATGGRLVLSGGSYYSGGVALQTDGKIVAALMTSTSSFTIVRLR